MTIPRMLAAFLCHVATVALCGCSSVQDRGSSVASPMAAGDQEAFELGLCAVELEDWPEAIREFERARKADPCFPPVLANLGLSHDRAGHPLAAIAWMRAYLAAVPAAPNAGSVRAGVSRLEAGVDSTVRQVLDDAWKMSRAKKDRPGMQGILRSSALMGDVRGALALAQGEDPTLLPESEAWSLFIRGQVRAGETAGIDDALQHITGSGDWDEAWKTIGYSRIAEMDLSGAGDATLHLHDTAAAMKLLEDAEKVRGENTSFQDRPTAHAVAAFSLREWTAFAESLSASKVVVDLAGALSEADASREPGASTGRAGAELGFLLLDAKGMARRHGRMMARFSSP